jgi:hypothetical protein
MALAAAATSLSYLNCSTDAFEIPELASGRVKYLDAVPGYTRYQLVPGGMYPNHGSVTAKALSYCNVTLTYWPHKNPDPTTVLVVLPDTKWNSRMQALGGSGWSAGINDWTDYQLIAAAYEGYSTIATDGGWPSNSPYDYALLPDGSVNMQSLKHYASTSLNDLAILGKDITAQYYGRPANKSYWNGCSQGGRQGFALAQLYPDAFDGIAASAPPVDWHHLMPAGFWSQVTMHELGVWLDPCELQALTNAAVEKCDPLDGVTDGIINDSDGCHFDAYSMVGKSASCGWKSVTISREAAILAHAGWGGMKASKQKFMHRAMNREAPFVSAGDPRLFDVIKGLNLSMGLTDTVNAPGGGRIGSPMKMVNDWLRLYLMKNATADTSQLSLEEFDRYFDMSIKEYGEVIGTDSKNLTGVRDRGAKIISYHGMVSYSKNFTDSSDYLGRSNRSSAKHQVLL